jgi:hypothetical protein
MVESSFAMTEESKFVIFRGLECKLVTSSFRSQKY